ncbi:MULTISPECIES: ABC transporter permease [Methanosarcina]|jgi:peptide/nickel transport system permease protein|uniref:ABC transporter permease n=5 Tax=Methanosarcina mazei TaxID=2209 RepID=Q50222_METMZ|nr:MULTISPECIES: ABC transporter permease [Methanosarcina]AKB41749.1 Oligopeptide transport system permease protein OppB [Methanosarcina mazei WWM610]AKB66022.1 Oligopeptide transport system permease protein OppB [Methanosarcina mazei S-6]AKB68851.1 Oligopeptide transport system permease protein OppB [Methanosarcina mazei LYC]AKB71494.1 Oligopeptide transport system permease protein OppB [Methanosarcina mazei C16]KKG01511.1 peptide ABC transporter permease [Methanosarcina mazei]
MSGITGKGTRYLASLALIIIINFTLPRLMPGDPVKNLIGEDVYVSEQVMEELRAELGLDRPLYEQFASFVSDILHLDLGYSYHLHAPVAEILLDRIGWTLLFVGSSVIIGAFAGSLLGALAGWKPEKRTSRVTGLAFIVFSCTPPYFLALLSLYIFSFRLGLFPSKGFYDAPEIGSILHHLFLPICVMSVFSASRNFLVMRGSVIQEKKELYALYARAKGLNDTGVLFRHVLKNSSLPIITLLALDFGFLFSGALFIEIIFSLNGMGTLIYGAIMGKDYPLLQGAFLVISLTALLANMLADLLYALIDPRVRRPA